MNDTVLRIDISRGLGYADADSLATWLGVQGLEAAPRVGDNDIDWRRVVRVTVRVTSDLAAQRLQRALAGWLATRPPRVSLWMRFAEGMAVELRGGATAEQVARQVETLLAFSGVELLAADSGPEQAAGSDGDRSIRISDDQNDRLAQIALRHPEVMARLDTIIFLAKDLLEEDRAITPEEARSLGSHLDVLGEVIGILRPVSGESDNPPSGRKPGESAVPTLPVTIYLSEERIHDQVEAAVDALLDTAGLRIEDRDEPVIGSWFRRMRATAKEVMHSPAGREGALLALHAADTRMVLAQDAAVTATLLQNLGAVIASLQPTKDAALRVGALLIVKVDWAVNVIQLTAAQQALLDHRPELALSPREIIAALGIVASGPDADSDQTLGIEGHP